MKRHWRRRRTESAPVKPTPPDRTPEDTSIIERATPLTMTGEARLQALIDAVRHCVAAGIKGDFVECGVWRGGSVLAMALTLLELDAADRGLHLFDTFEGMTEPTGRDVSVTGDIALRAWGEARDGERLWSDVFGEDQFGEAQVRTVLEASDYPGRLIHLVPGQVEDTVPAAAPEQIALLRLDTDWYESTKHELEHLYPRLAPGGILIVDDYGHWQGAREAVDEYFATNPPAPFLHRIDYTGRLAVKPHASG